MKKMIKVTQISMKMEINNYFKTIIYMELIILTNKLMIKSILNKSNSSKMINKLNKIFYLVNKTNLIKIRFLIR